LTAVAISTPDQFLKSRITSYLVTTLFNFSSISILLFLSYSIVPSRGLATLSAHSLGMFLSMLFSIDFWWSRVSKEMSPDVTLPQRLRFLGIASIAAVISTLITSLEIFQNAETFSLVLINWSVLFFVSVTKYLVMVKIVQKGRGH